MASASFRKHQTALSGTHSLHILQFIPFSKLCLVRFGYRYIVIITGVQRGLWKLKVSLNILSKFTTNSNHDAASATADLSGCVGDIGDLCDVIRG